jgi:hypothetical protein
MTREERLLVINKLAFIGYYTHVQNKDSVFLTIAAIYNTSEENCIVIAKHVEDVVNKKATWDSNIINNIK